MAGFVTEVLSIHECLTLVSRSLGFPWHFPCVTTPLRASLGARIAENLTAKENLPPFTRSLRDGYAVRAADVSGASPSSPVFLRIVGEIAMSEIPTVVIRREEAAAIPTGGALPEGADAVVMIEDTSSVSGWLEVRRAVQSLENIASAGEEISSGSAVAARGDIVDSRTAGLFSSLGMTHLPILLSRIKILSTGNEIVPIDIPTLPPGCVRDANAWILHSTLARYGFPSEMCGIVSDDGEALSSRVEGILRDCDALVLSGGSSVGVRDFTAKIMESLPSPGLLVRGVNMIPGKPTLIGASLIDKKMIIGLPGHPLSCLVTCVFVLMPLLLQMIGADNASIGCRVRLPLLQDVQGRTGVEEFVPMRIEKMRAAPLHAKSGYVSAMRDTNGFIILPENVETLRADEEAEVWLW